MLVAAGAGAGIATTFNAPIGGLMFAQEIVLLGETEIANLTLLMIATFSAVVISRAITGNAVVFHPPTFVLRSYWEMVTYALMGVLLGVLSAGYIHFFHATAAAFRATRSCRNGRKLALGLLIVGVIAISLPQNLSDGYPMINRAMEGHFAHRDDARADRREVFRLQRVARMRRAGRRLRPDLLYRHDGGSEFSAHDGLGTAEADGAARIVRADRIGRLSVRRHARAADRAFPAARHDRRTTRSRCLR